MFISCRPASIQIGCDPYPTFRFPSFPKTQLANFNPTRKLRVLKLVTPGRQAWGKKYGWACKKSRFPMIPRSNSWVTLKCRKLAGRNKQN